MREIVRPRRQTHISIRLVTRLTPFKRLKPFMSSMSKTEGDMKRKTIKIETQKQSNILTLLLTMHGLIKLTGKREILGSAVFNFFFVLKVRQKVIY